MPGQALSPERINELIEESLEANRAFDVMVLNELFGRGCTPDNWTEWPDWAKTSWADAAYAYRDAWRLRNPTEERVPKPKARRYATIPEAWAAIEAGALTWAQLGKRLKMTTRTTEYRLHVKMGFSFQGAAKDRKLIKGPCIQCERPFVVASLDEKHVCGVCRMRETRGRDDNAV